MKKKGRTRKRRTRGRRYSSFRLKLTVAALSVLTLALFYAAVALTLHYYRFSRLIDQRLAGERSQRPAWVFARPYEIRDGQRLSRRELVDVVNALRYRQVREAPREPGSFQAGRESVLLWPRRASQPLRVTFRDLWIGAIADPGREHARWELEPVPVTPLFGENRAKRRWVRLSEIPPELVQAVVATEDRRFFDHTGLDPIGIARAAWEDLRAGEIRQGGSTLTQQLVKNYFLSQERTIRRKLLEAFLAVILESRAGKEEILELYLNDVYLGQRGSFAIHGVGQAARVFFGKDASNLALEEAALLAALIRAPNGPSPFDAPGEARARRNVVLAQMRALGFIDRSREEAAAARPLRVEPGTVDVSEAPYFVDALRRRLVSRLSADRLQDQNLSIRSTLDRYLQDAAQSAVVEGLQEIEAQRSGRTGPPIQAALVALDPATGDVLALVGGRSYGTSQFNRATDARRQPGSAFKPFVYLAAFEHTREQARGSRSGAPLLTPASFVVDEPTTFRYENRRWSPQNYDGRFAGRVSLRHALSRSLNVATARVGAAIGFERVVSLWKRIDADSRLAPYPSLVLGAFEVTPLELAAAYAVIANGGHRVEPRFYTAVRDARDRVVDALPVERRRVVQAETAYLVTDMMRAVIDEGTGREIRARGFRADAAGKTGTTNDARDAWFAGFTPDVLAVVWVGYDDNRPLGLPGSHAALPIWTRFMKAAVSGRDTRRFEPPPGLVSARIDPATGRLAGPSCPRRRVELFLRGTEPTGTCSEH